ncbi:succinate dehydrogenase, cytochrome b556 subunit [Amylibacter marinus]|uniref:Succinate dehydrogenase cytochrome b556 subunit n=2 Tax=Amylibacter marinus TaxID=1475483 RepID=A0ABQ5VSV6_9RHOB|nr:succinate dehydrogenase, cytochrome b556 subunit [Amylibacter marinus]
MTSIFVRLTGISLTLGFVMVIWWLLAAATGPEYFATVNGLLTGWFAVIIWVLSIWALWYHSLGGIRHLIWDLGYGFDVKTADRMGYGVIAGSFVLTALSLICLGVL